MANITITTRSNRWEDSAVIELEDGSSLQAVVTHIPGVDAIFSFSHVQEQDDADATVTELFTCPVQTA